MRQMSISDPPIDPARNEIMVVSHPFSAAVRRGGEWMGHGMALVTGWTSKTYCAPERHITMQTRLPDKNYLVNLTQVVDFIEKFRL